MAPVRRSIAMSGTLSPVRSGKSSPGVRTSWSTSLPTLTGLDQNTPWSIERITSTLRRGAGVVVLAVPSPHEHVDQRAVGFQGDLVAHRLVGLSRVVDHPRPNHVAPVVGLEANQVGPR